MYVHEAGPQHMSRGRGQFCEVCSLPPSLPGFWGMSSDGQAGEASTVSAEPAHQLLAHSSVFLP